MSCYCYTNNCTFAIHLLFRVIQIKPITETSAPWVLLFIILCAACRRALQLIMSIFVHNIWWQNLAYLVLFRSNTALKGAQTSFIVNVMVDCLFTPGRALTSIIQTPVIRTLMCHNTFIHLNRITVCCEYN